MAWNEPGKGRDPWGGRGGNQGAPDLDEMVRNMQRKLGGLFGGGGAGGGGSGTLGIIGLVLLGLLTWETIHIVQPGERGVVLRFGQHVATLEPGPAIRFPRPIEGVHKVNVEEVKQFSHKALMLTEDENIVDVELAVQFRRTDAATYLFNVVGPEQTLGEAAESAIREIAGKNTMDFILGAGRAEVAQTTQALLQTVLDDYNSGLTVLAVNLVDAQPPEQVQPAFADAIKAREDQERIINQAQAYANDLIPRARGGAARQLEEANAYLESVVSRAEGEAARFTQLLQEYERAPAVTRQRLYLETVEWVLENNSKVLIDSRAGGNLLYLPLDQLMKGAAAAGAAAMPQPEPRAERAEQDPRQRDGLRGRRAP